MNEIGVIDLFCGIGGLTFGIQEKGMKVVKGIDIEQSCKYAYEKNNNADFINQSVSELTGENIKAWLKDYKIKIVVGCAPCQPFSNHQKDKRNRKNHKHWGLLYEFLRIVKESEPDYISMENVPALIKEEVFIDFVESLKKINYRVSYSVIDISNYGLAQSRKRLILLAAKGKEIKICKPKILEKKTVRQIISYLPEISNGEICENDPLHRSSKLSSLNIKRIQHSIPGGTWRDWPEDLLAECHKKESGKSYSSVYGRMSWDKLSPTITTQFNAYGTGRFGHPEQDRALSLREGALLQSFPKKYKFIEDEENINITVVARQIGNAVPPILGEIIAESILENINMEN